MRATRPAMIALILCLGASSVAADELALSLGDSVPSAQAGQADQGAEKAKTPKHKSMMLAFVMSAIVPSSGQFYNGEYQKGVLQLALIGGGLVIHFMTSEEGDKEILGDPGLVIVAITWMWSMFDAPTSAYRINQEIDRKAGESSAALPARRWDVYGALSPGFDSGRAGLLVRF